MGNLGSVLINGAVGEILFYLTTAIILIPFAVVESQLSKKLSRTGAEDRKTEKFHRRAKTILFLATVLTVGISGFLILRYAFGIPVFGEDTKGAVLFVASIASGGISRCLYDLIRCLKQKKRTVS